ncbi:RNA chaperone ProQ [Rheinheimera sp. UJ63]|uniref:RNA chaperone ProQ n=1 Tax=Rheinheimera sp. UJ63 TaxID=2910157 RepID=UPI001F490C6B|nr:RNA chaperone ProQ [Rheinheimera sp. UJ63]MCF4009738.1 RNA chaperone ProQ [Rheinheimera sp. UJ63]
MTNPPAELVEATDLPTAEHAKLANVKDVLAYLVSEFPLCFAADQQVKPLKVGIFQDLAARLAADSPVSKTQLRQALRVYTLSWRYLESVKEGVSRVDLDGQAAERIDAQQAEHAAKLLAESKQKAAEKRKAKMQEQRAKQNVAKPVAAGVDKKRPNKTAERASKAQKVPAKATSVKATIDVAPVAVTLTTVEPTQLATGDKVLVKLGSSPMPATITEVNLPDVTVQLGSGMIIKTRQDSLYKA